MLAFVDVEERVPKDHPLRTIKAVVDEALERLSGGGERLRNETHRSRTDPEARLMRKGKGKEARLSFMGHAATPSWRTAAGFHPKTLGGDKGYDTRECVRGHAQSWSDAPCGSAHTLCDRRSHHTASGLQDEPEDSQAGGGDIRVDEDCGRISADPVSGSGAHRVGRILGGHGLQPGANGQPAVATAEPCPASPVTCPRALGRTWPDGTCKTNLPIPPHTPKDFFLTNITPSTPQPVDLFPTQLILPQPFRYLW